MKAAIPAVLLLSLASCGRKEELYVKISVERQLKAAAVHEEAGRLDEAIAAYDACLALVGTNEKWKTLSTEWRAVIRRLEDLKARTAEFAARFRKWEAIRARDDATDQEWLIREGSELLWESDGCNLPWRPKLAVTIEALRFPVDKR